MDANLSAADIVAMTRDANGTGNGAWDNPFIYLVWLALLGNGGLWGNRGGAGSTDGGTERVIYEGFNNQDINGQLRGITQGICDGFYAVNTGMLTGFNGLQGAIANLGFQSQQCCCDTEKAIMQTSFQNQAGFNALSTQLAQCCCDMKYDLASQFCDTRNTIQNTTRDIIENQNGNTRAILDFLVKDKIDSLTAENQVLRFQASQTAQNNFITANQEAQTAELIRRLGRDIPVPAYVVPNPNCCYGYGYGATGGCGCGCG